MDFSIGDKVRLNVPENTRLHGTEAGIRVLTDWGAHVACASAATGLFRALWEEMEPLGTVDHAAVEAHAASYDQWLNGPARQNGQPKPPPPHQGIPPVLSSTGEVCVTCGSLDMMRAGSCLTCRACGSTSGCS